MYFNIVLHTVRNGCLLMVCSNSSHIHDYLERDMQM